jgi:hypothetical protein
VSELDEVKAGALLAIGIVCASVTDDNEPAMAILPDYVTHRSQMLRTQACMGLGLAYVPASQPLVATHSRITLHVRGCTLVLTRLARSQVRRDGPCRSWANGPRGVC